MDIGQKNESANETNKMQYPTNIQWWKYFLFYISFFIDSCLKVTSIWMQSSGRWHLILRRFSNRERNESEIKFKLLRTLFNQFVSWGEVSLLIPLVFLSQRFVQFRKRKEEIMDQYNELRQSFEMETLCLLWIQTAKIRT